MKIKEIRDMWINFVEKYKEYLCSADEKWFGFLDDLQLYVNNNKKFPSESDKNKQIEILARWFYNQAKKYNSKSGLMKNKEIYDAWTKFINDNESLYVKRTINL
jgi:hypothetical protein